MNGLRKEWLSPIPANSCTRLNKRSREQCLSRVPRSRDLDLPLLSVLPGTESRCEYHSPRRFLRRSLLQRFKLTSRASVSFDDDERCQEAIAPAVAKTWPSVTGAPPTASASARFLACTPSAPPINLLANGICFCLQQIRSSRGVRCLHTTSSHTIMATSRARRRASCPDRRRRGRTTGGKGAPW
jgi:hypothetical protein